MAELREVYPWRQVVEAKPLGYLGRTVSCSIISGRFFQSSFRLCSVVAASHHEWCSLLEMGNYYGNVKKAQSREDAENLKQRLLMAGCEQPFSRRK